MKSRGSLGSREGALSMQVGQPTGATEDGVLTAEGIADTENARRRESDGYAS